MKMTILKLLIMLVAILMVGILCSRCTTANVKYSINEEALKANSLE